VTILTIPNLITLTRIILTPLYLYFILVPRYGYKLASLIIFSIAIFTDLIDGYYARKYGKTSRTGNFLDPLADKILIISAYISFTFVNDLIPIWMVLVIFIRDLVVTGLRIAFERKGLSMTTRKTAKYKTAIQGFNIFFILIYLVIIEHFNIGFLNKLVNFIEEYKLVYDITLVATIITVYTGIDYILVNRKILKESGAHSETS